MSLTYGFYNSINSDRKYTASQLSSLFDGIIRDGIFLSIGNKLMVTAVSGMNIKVGTGRAWFNHTWTINDADLPLTVDESEIILNRIDTVVLEVNSNDDVRANSIKIIKGTPSSTPVAPTLIRTDFVNQYPLCDIYVGVGVTSIAQANITNRVGTSDTPFVTGILDSMNIDALMAQWGNEFLALKNQWGTNVTNLIDEWDATFLQWFNSFSDVLDENTAANLLALINANALNLTALSEDVTELSNKQLAHISAYINCKRKLRMGVRV